MNTEDVSLSLPISVTYIINYCEFAAATCESQAVKNDFIISPGIQLNIASCELSREESEIAREINDRNMILMTFDVSSRKEFQSAR